MGNETKDFATSIDEQILHTQGQIRFESNGPAVNLNYIISKTFCAERQCITGIHTKAIIDIFSINHIQEMLNLKLITGSDFGDIQEQETSNLRCITRYDSGVSHFFRSTLLGVNIRREDAVGTPEIALPDDFVEYVCSYVWNIGAKAVMMERGMTEITGRRREWLLPHPSNFLNSFRPDAIGRYSSPPLAVLTVAEFRLEELVKQLLLSVNDPEHRNVVKLCIGDYLK